MKIAITGSHGLIGSQLVKVCQAEGHQVIPIVRKPAGTGNTGEICWTPEEGQIESQKLEGINAIIHLGGVNVGETKWTNERKEAIRQSRVKGTETLVAALINLTDKPEVFICASALGYYGDRHEETVNEFSDPGEGFLPQVVTAWEAATDPIKATSIRLVNLRIGVVLSPEGGMLGKMIPAFKMCLGGVMGCGCQYISWISRTDVVRALMFAITHHNLRGPVNAVSPAPCDNRTFTKTLGKILKRPTLVRMPSFLVRILFGQMGQELILSDTRVDPVVLKEHDFIFIHDDIRNAITDELRNNPVSEIL